MGDRTKIEWTDASWNPLRGCSRVSEGCRHCYAERVAARFSGPGQPYEGLAKAVTRPDGSREARWTGKVEFVEHMLEQPLRWKRPRRIFVNSMSDPFHEGITDEQLERIFAVMALAPQHTFQVLTKRPARMQAWVSRAVGLVEAAKYGGTVVADELPHITGAIATPGAVTDWPMRHVWLGVSVEDQTRADQRVPILLKTPAAVRWISAEPLLGPLDLTKLDNDRDRGWAEPMSALQPYTLAQAREDWGEDCEQAKDSPALDWVVVGGESGAGARPMHPDWARALRDQCTAAGVAFLFKQWGEWAPLATGENTLDVPKSIPLKAVGDRAMKRIGKNAAGRELDGATWDQYPDA